MPYKDATKQKVAQHASYLRRKEKQVERNRNERQTRRAVVSTYKVGKGCEVCGYDRCASVLHAHHHNDDKEKGVAEMIRDCANVDAILKELGKCRILCANCHIEEHLM